MRQEFFINELPPMLNGSNGLQRLHWAQYQKLKESWVWLVRQQNPKTHEGRVNVRMTRVSTNTPDPDNVSAGFKVIGDALEDLGIIEDDSFNTINDFRVNWQKADSRKAQGVRIEIESLSEN